MNSDIATTLTEENLLQSLSEQLDLILKWTSNDKLRGKHVFLKTELFKINSDLQKTKAICYKLGDDEVYYFMCLYVSLTMTSNYNAYKSIYMFVDQLFLRNLNNSTIAILEKIKLRPIDIYRFYKLCVFLDVKKFIVIDLEFLSADFLRELSIYYENKDLSIALFIINEEILKRSNGAVIKEKILFYERKIESENNE